VPGKEPDVCPKPSGQGALKESGQPVSGTCTGTPVQTEIKSNVRVSNGLFTVAMDVIRLIKKGCKHKEV